MPDMYAGMAQIKQQIEALPPAQRDMFNAVTQKLRDFADSESELWGLLINNDRMRSMIIATAMNTVCNESLVAVERSISTRKALADELANFRCSESITQALLKNEKS